MSRYFIDHPIVAQVLAILVVIAGGVMIFRLPVAQLPEIAPPQIQTTATYTGADALTVEQSVATPIDEQVNGAKRMIYMQAISANDGTMTLQVSFDVETDIDMDQVQVQNRLAQAQASLPTAVNAYGLTTIQTAGIPLLVFTVTSPNRTWDQTFLSNYIAVNVQDELARVPGIGQVRVFGASNYAMRVWVAPDTIANMGLTVTDLTNAISAQNTVNPAGEIGGEPAPPGREHTYTVRARGRLVNAEEFGDIVVRANADGSLVRLRDVARIELGVENYNMQAYTNGAPAALIGLYQVPGSNALGAANRAKATMARLADRFPEDMQADVTLDTTIPVTEGAKEIVITLVEAIGLVLVVVFVFLQSLRATWVPIQTIPVSLIGTFLFFPMMGFTINTLSLLGLVLAVGLVVDDAIVVVEAVQAKIDEGLSPRDAAVAAMDEVGGAVVGIALVLSSVFIPAGFILGITGSLYRQFALTIAFSVLLSAVNALTLKPAQCAAILRPRSDEGRRGLLGPFFAVFDRVFASAQTGYVHGARFLIRRAGLAFLLLAAFAALAGGLGKVLPRSFMPQEDQGYFLVNVQLPEAASLQRTNAVMRKLDEILKGQPGVHYINSVSGFSILSQTSSPRSGLAFVQLAPYDERATPELQADAIVDAVNAKLSALPGAQVMALLPPAIPGVGQAGGVDFFIQDRAGGTVDHLWQNTQRFIAEARKRPAIAFMRTTFTPAAPQLFAHVDEDRVFKLGLPIQDVYGSLQALLGGTYVNQFNRFGRVWRVFVEAEPQYRADPSNVSLFHVRNGTGEMVPLSSVVDLQKSSGPEFVTRFNGYRGVEVFAVPARGYSTGQAMAAVAAVADEVLPRDMGYAWNGMSYQQSIAGSGLGVFALSLVLVFLILAALYRSWSLPWTILLSTPIAVAGAFVGLWARGLDNDVYAQVGLLMLIGLSAKNAILIVEYAKSELERGASLVDAALTGARRRLRPILMTSFAFIFGLLPLWSALGAGGIARRLIGTVTISGMLFSTAIAILLVPVLFVVVERVSRRWRRPAEADTSSPTDVPMEEHGR
ncbi:MAG TPA: efflux RND transporter permease subunit [Candidatus Eisenbacteria bacterium]|nr:efflux RND transporter permease subunit [Candidatus Eisenbacteria bacterium]